MTAAAMARSTLGDVDDVTPDVASDIGSRLGAGSLRMVDATSGCGNRAASSSCTWRLRLPQAL
ncbi:MAG: hypothetical protein DMF78_07350 [Acidobacteria bacterium]|nr:MAG: hypothetical protein DMF78_07350 [Acidobacteriota bacterium]